TTLSPYRFVQICFFFLTLKNFCVILYRPSICPWLSFVRCYSVLFVSLCLFVSLWCLGMLLIFYLHYRNVLLAFHCKIQLRSTMSGSTEPSQLLMSVRNIKEKSDHFLQEYLFEIQTVEEKPELEHDCKTETHTSPTLTGKEENSSLMEIKEEGESRSEEHTSELQS